MSDLAKKYLEEALLLPIEERAELVDQLLQSLNTAAQKEVDLLWAEEAEKRVREYKEGKVESLNGETVFKEIRDKYQKFILKQDLNLNNQLNIMDLSKQILD